MTDIPDNVMQAAREAMDAKAADPEWFLYETGVKHTARAILAEREKFRKRVEELEAGLRMIEAWWVTRGMLETTSIGAPYEMFHIRTLLRKEGTDA